MKPPIDLLIGTFEAALRAVEARNTVPFHLPASPRGTLFVIGAGKASAAMAVAVEDNWPDSSRLEGLVLTRHGHGLATRRIEVIEGGHPLPDRLGMVACGSMLQLLEKATPEDRVLVLLSGGGSSLLTLPEQGLVLEEIQKVTRNLLLSGAPIADINCVRKHLSRTLGGKMAARCHAPARVLIISDVVGDAPGVIASGPFYPDASTFTDALEVLTHWSIDTPKAVFEYLDRGRRGLERETLKPEADCFLGIQTRIIANAHSALEAAVVHAHAMGINAYILDDSAEDEARDLGQAHAQHISRHFSHRPAGEHPVMLLSGGETRVRVQGTGRGGRNSEYLLSLAMHLGGMPGVYALAADTDGIDGTEQNAGALLSPEIWQAAQARHLDATAFLERNDAYGYFSALDALIVTGPTRTNVNDFRAILIT